MAYNPQTIEEHWQAVWNKEKSFIVEKESNKEKYYVLEMFPYPSGNIHMGHVRNYALGDVLARYKRMQGYNVLHPIGWDAFGLPAENAAIKNNTHPFEWTMNNIATMKKQLQRLGYSYDWTKEITTCLPEYYRWEQLFFIRFLKNNLVYRKKAPQNWCPCCQTVLANEQVKDNACWRCDGAIEQKELTQWFMRITQYADELLENLDSLTGWGSNVLEMQRNWIGKSFGAEVDFSLEARCILANGEDVSIIRIFTTRIDTIFGVSAIVLAPEHSLATLWATQDEEFAKNVCTIQSMPMAERQNPTTKIGAFTGKYVLHPITQERIPIWIANFVLAQYGTGAVMCVPAHDERDFAFAKQYALPIHYVIIPEEHKDQGSAYPHTTEQPYTEEGILIECGEFSTMPTAIAREKLVEYLENKGIATAKVQYKLRDWNISRQRYWGTPIPVIYCDTCGIVPEKEENLPVILPTNVHMRADGKSPLPFTESFVHTTCPQCMGNATRETDTLDTFFESSWYFLRYANPSYTEAPVDTNALQGFMPVGQYIGGIEHAVMHLLYARFFTMLLNDMGFVQGVREPFKNLLTQGMVLKDGAKMSKSKGNTVDPTQMIAQYGADTVRLFCLFAAPPERDFDWSDSGIEGSFRFLNRVYALYEHCKENLHPCVAGFSATYAPFTNSKAQELYTKEHSVIKKYNEDIARFQYNTAISSIMELVNMVYKHKDELENVLEHQEYSALISSAFASILTLLAPFTPHITEELWHSVGNTGSIHKEAIPQHDEKALIKNEYTVAVQINGKMRGTCTLPANISEEQCLAHIHTIENYAKYLEGKEIIKIILIPNKICNILVK